MTNMSVFLLNATSLAKLHALQLLETELFQLQCYFALITETWFTDKQQNSVVSIAGYSLYRRDRKSGKGGGVCAYVRSDNHCTTFVPDVDTVTINDQHHQLLGQRPVRQHHDQDLSLFHQSTEQPHQQ